MLPVQGLCLLGDLRPIALVLALHLPDQGRHALHLLLRPDLSHEERGEQGADDDREEDDREREVREGELVDRDQEVEERQEEDVPGRREMLDPQESGSDGECQVAGSLADRVIAARMKRVAASNAASPHPGASQQPVALDGHVGVLGAARRVTAAWRHPTRQLPVGDDQSEPDLPHSPILDRSEER